jgi:hypothetical protein
MLAGQKIYVLTSPRDVSSVFRETKSLTYEKFCRDLLKMFACSNRGIEKVWAASTTSEKFVATHTNSKALCLGALTMELFARQFLPGPKLDSFARIILHRIDESLQYEDPTTPHARKSSTSRSNPLQLRVWCAEIINDAVCHALLGTQFTRTHPQYLDAFFRFNTSGWKLIFGYPRWIAPQLYQDRDEMLTCLEEFLKLPRAYRSDQSWLIHCMEDESRALGIDEKDMASMWAMILWV